MLARLLHAAFVGGLAALFAIQALKRLGPSSTAVLIGGAALAGVAAALACWRLRWFRTFLTVLSPAPLVFLGVFLLGSPVRELVFPADVKVNVARVSADAPVVVVVLDELPVVSLMNREGEIDAARFPNFARLARDSTWFRNTTTLSSSTTLAVPALLTGKVPRRGKLPVFQEHPNNLFTLLGGRYHLNVTESQTHLCPPRLCRRRGPGAVARLESLYSDARVVYLHLVAPPALEERLAPIDEAWGNFGKETTIGGETTTVPREGGAFYVGRVRDFKRFIRTARGKTAGRPWLNLLHVLLPHGPWLYFPSGRASAVASARAPGRQGELWVDDWLVLQAYQRHLLQLGFTDRLLGQLLARLDRLGLYDRALIVVTADHGVSFRGGDKRRTPTPTNLQDLAFVPLFVKRPGQEAGEVIARHVRTIDILPTIADALGVDMPWRIDGRSAFTAGTPVTRVRVGRLAGDYTTLLRRRGRALARQVRLFGSGTWGPRLFGLGAERRLLGRSVRALAVADGADAAVTVDPATSRLLRSLPRRSALLPSPLTGTVSGNDAAPRELLAIAVNGRIASVARTFQFAGATRFSGLAPESAFKAGANAVTVYLVAGEGASTRLRPLTTSLS